MKQEKAEQLQRIKGSIMGGSEKWAKIGQKLGNIGGICFKVKCLLHEQEVAGSSPAPPTNF